MGVDNEFFNAAAPVIIQHQLSAGFTREINDVWSVSLAYVHMFKNDIEGPFIAPVVGAVPGTSVRSEVVADSLIVGTSVRF